MDDTWKKTIFRPNHHFDLWGGRARYARLKGVKRKGKGSKRRVKGRKKRLEEKRRTRKRKGGEKKQKEK